MITSDLEIYLQDEEIPEVTVQKFSNFYIVNIEGNLQPKIKFFLYSEQQVESFRNNLLWAFEKPIKITE